MLSAFYICYIYSSALQTIFYHGSKHYEPWSDCSPWEPSDLGPYCLQCMTPKNMSRWGKRVTKVVTGWIMVKMVNSLLFLSQFSCMVSIKTIDSEAAWKKCRSWSDHGYWSGSTIFLKRIYLGSAGQWLIKFMQNNIQLMRQSFVATPHLIPLGRAGIAWCVLLLHCPIVRWKCLGSDISRQTWQCNVKHDKMRDRTAIPAVRRIC